MQVWEYTLRKGIVKERDINYLQDMIVFPSNIYSVGMKESLNKGLIECFIFSSNIREKITNPVFSYIEPIGDTGAYVTINMVDIHKLHESREDIILGNILANFIVSTDFAPFLIHKKALFLPANPEYLFSWNNVPGNDSKRLLRYLRDDRDIDWAEGAEIFKSDDGKTIHILKDKKSAKIMINEKEERVTLKISDGRTHDLKVRKKSGKLNIYGNKNLGWFWDQKSLNDVETNMERFVDYQRRLNPLLFFIEDLDYEGETEYQTEKFKNAISALKFLISRGFPYEEVIDWNSNRIINEGIKKELMKGDVDIDYQFIQGNIENRFCRLVRFALKIFIQNRERLIEDLTKFGEVYKNSSLYIFEAIKPFIDDYIPSKVSIEKHKARSKLEYDKTQKIPEPYFKYIIVIMRNKQPFQDFTRIFLDAFLNKYKSSTLFGGFECEIEGVDTNAQDKKRYKIHVYFDHKNGIPLIELPNVLTDIKLKMRSEVFDVLRSINETDFIEEMQKPANSEFWLFYVGVLVPHNEDIYNIHKKIFDYNFGFEQKYAHYVEKIFSHSADEKQDIFELAFPNYFDISIDKFFYRPTKLDKADILTTEAVNLALSGKFYESKMMLFEAGVILDADYEFLKGYIKNKSGFTDYEEYERWLKELEGSYLFSWDSVPGDHNERLIRYLGNNFDIDWVEKAEIRKSRDDMTISISTDENSAEIRLDDTKGKAILKISDGRTYDLKVIMENGELNLYMDSYPKGYQNYNESIKEERTTFLPHFDKKPILCHNIGEYKEKKEINKWFTNCFHEFKEIDEKRKEFLQLKDRTGKDYNPGLSKIQGKFEDLGIYKRKDLKYLEEVLNALKLKVDLSKK